MNTPHEKVTSKEGLQRKKEGIGKPGMGAGKDGGGTRVVNGWKTYRARRKLEE